MDLVADIRSHISEVASDPAGKALDPRLLEKFDGQVTGVQPAVPKSCNGLRSSRFHHPDLL